MMSHTLPSTLGHSTFYPPNTPPCGRRGWLRRQGGLVKSWQHRWFALRGQCLFYYSTDDESRPHCGSVFLPGYRVVKQPQQAADPEKFLFLIEPDGDRSRTLGSTDSHLLCAASDDDRRQWILAIRTVLYAGEGGAIFGQRLDDIMSYQSKRNRRPVPDIVECCVNFLLRHGLETEGIFRLAGRSALVRRLREAFDCGQRPVLLPPETDAHSVASLLKQFLRELPEPLIPLRLYERVMQLCTRDMCEQSGPALLTLHHALAAMPPAPRTLLAYVSCFLHKVALHAPLNRMPPANLATVFVTAYIRPELDDPVLLLGTSASRSQAVLVLITAAPHLFSQHVTADQLTHLTAALRGQHDSLPQALSWPAVQRDPQTPPEGATQQGPPEGATQQGRQTPPEGATQQDPPEGATQQGPPEGATQQGPQTPPEGATQQDPPEGATQQGPPEGATQQGPQTPPEGAMQQDPPEGAMQQGRQTPSEGATQRGPQTPPGGATKHKLSCSPTTPRTTGHENVSQRPSRPRSSFDCPVAPPRQSAHINVTKSLAAVINGTERLSVDGAVVDEASCEWGVDVSSCSATSLCGHVSELRAEVTALRVRLRQAHDTAAQREARQRDATADAVSKIVQLQATIQEYELKYGPLG